MLIDLKMVGIHGTAKVINYMLNEVILQTFNEGSFLPYLKSSIINAFEKVCTFTLTTV